MIGFFIIFDVNNCSRHFKGAPPPPPLLHTGICTKSAHARARPVAETKSRAAFAAGPFNGTTIPISLAHRIFAISERRITNVGPAKAERNAVSRVGVQRKDSRLFALHDDGTLRAKTGFEKRYNKHLETFHVPQ